MEEQKTRIYRERKERNFTIIHNEILKRNDLSWKAKGIMCYVLSLPDDWIIYLEELMKHATDKKASFRSGWDELKEKGYVHRYPIRESGKIVEWRTEIKESVGIEPFSPHTDFQEVEKLEVGFQEVENRKLLSTNNTKDLNKQSTNNTKVLTSNSNNNNIYIQENNFSLVFSSIEKEFGRGLSPIEMQTINFWIDEDGFIPEVILLALREAVLNQAYSLKYMQTILISWEKKNFKSANQIKEHLSKFERNKQEIKDDVVELPEIPMYNWLDPNN